MTFREIWSRVIVVYGACLLASAGGFAWLIGSPERHIGKHLLFAAILWLIVDQFYKPKDKAGEQTADQPEELKPVAKRKEK